MNEKKFFKEITGRNLEEVKETTHHTSQYVDDSSNIVGTNDRKDMTKYISQYMNLLEDYYTSNKLKINTEKTTFMVTKSRNKNQRMKIDLVNGEVITDDLAIKLLGWWTTPNGSMGHHVNKIRGLVYNALAKLKPFMGYMSLKQRKDIVYAKAMGIAGYGLGLYLGQPEIIKDKLTTIYMRANRQIYHLPLPLKTKNAWICRKVGVKTPRQLIIESGLKFMHRIVNTQLPHEIFKQIKFPKRFRKTVNLTTVTNPKTIKCKRCLIYKSLRYYNNLHSSLKFLHPKIFKRSIEKRKILEIPDD